MAVKGERLQIRVDLAAKRILEDAAEAMQMTVSAYVLQAAMRQAEDHAADRRLIHLSRSSAEAFVEALEKPAEVNDRLAATLSRPRKFGWLD